MGATLAFGLYWMRSSDCRWLEPLVIAKLLDSLQKKDRPQRVP